MVGQMDYLPGASSQARRGLRREEMSEFGAQLPWLGDPDLIPDYATALEGLPPAPGSEGNRHYSLAWWMIDSMVAWSERVHPKLSYGPVFDRHELSNEARVAVRDTIRDEAIPSYGTGIFATSQVYCVTPSVAAREGIHDPARWSEIASKARLFGRQIAYDGSNVLSLVREYLTGGYVEGNDVTRFDPAKVKLDALTGITTVTPIDTIVETVKAVLKEMDILEEDNSGVCVALQAAPAVCPKASPTESMFDLVWSAYGVPTRKYIYSREQPGSGTDIPDPEAPDTNLHETFRQQILRSVEQ